VIQQRKREDDVNTGCSKQTILVLTWIVIFKDLYGCILEIVYQDVSSH